MAGQSEESVSPDYLTAAQLADLLQVSTNTIWRWAKSEPSMPVLRIGDVVRFPRERIERWLRAQEQGAARPQRARRSATGEVPTAA